MSDLRKSDDLFVTECICYPRSGHHLLYSLLDGYFGERLHHGEIYRDPESHIDKNPQTNFQKNHDFDLQTPIRTDVKYIIQIRDPIDSLASYWELSTRTGDVPDTQEAYNACAKTWLEHWTGLMLKWVVPKLENRLIVRYRELVEFPNEVLTNVIQFMQGYQNVAHEGVRRALACYTPTQRRTKQLPFAHYA